MTHAKLKVETLPLIRLRPHPKNPRVHPEPGSERWNALKKSLDDSYWDPLIWNRKNGMLVSGHLRAKVLDEMGCKKADTVVVNFTEKQHVRVMLRANRNDGDWENDQLTALLKEMQDDERLLAGFDLDGLKELDIELNGEKEMEDAEPQIDRAKELQKKWNTQSGQIWEVGEHRLMCGSATDESIIKQIPKSDAIVTDPPYGVGVDYGPSFTDTQENVAALIKEVMPILLDFECPTALTCGHRMMWDYPRPSWVMAWVHPAGNGRNPWGFTMFNPILAYGKDPYLAQGLGSRGDTLVLAADRDLETGHPAIKPLEVWQWLVERLSPSKGELIFDPFLGSGTTMVACQNLERKCIGVEIAPEYVAVALQRMQDAFGITGELVK